MDVKRPSAVRRHSSFRFSTDENHVSKSKLGLIFGLEDLAYFLHSIWLFTFSDLKTIVLPSTAFALLHDIGQSTFSTKTEDSDNAWPNLPMKTTAVLLWAWLNLLPFVIDNQRQADGIREDQLNKPWRPLPSGRMSRRQATVLVWILYPFALTMSFYLGAPAQSIVLLALGVCYNDLGGADHSWVTRNLINACGFVCYTSGALQTALQKPVLGNAFLSKWFVIIGAVVFTTVQTQDMYDQAGDRDRERQTVPLVLGDGLSRWTIAVPMVVWSCFCPWFWSMPLVGYIVPATLGAIVCIRTLVRRSVADDKTTFRLWNLWLVSLYALPPVRLWIVGD